MQQKTINLTLEDLSDGVGQLLELGLVFLEEVSDDGSEVRYDVDEAVRCLLNQRSDVGVQLLELAFDLHQVFEIKA